MWSAELVTSLTSMVSGTRAKIQYLKDGRFGHLLRDSVETEEKSAGRASARATPVKAQLATARTKSEIVELVRGLLCQILYSISISFANFISTYKTPS